MTILKEFDTETTTQLIDSAYQFLLDKKSLPLKKLTYNVRIPFSAIYQFLRGNPQKQIAKLDVLQKQLAPEIIANIKEKLYLLYSANYSKVGLLTNYKFET